MIYACVNCRLKTKHEPTDNPLIERLALTCTNCLCEMVPSMVTRLARALCIPKGTDDLDNAICSTVEYLRKLFHPTRTPTHESEAGDGRNNPMG